MKIATYHRLLGDDVRFYKGNLDDLVVGDLSEDCVKKLKKIDNSGNWELRQTEIKKIIKAKRAGLFLVEELGLEDNPNKSLIVNCLVDFIDNFKYKKYAEKPKYDRIYVTTLFTFYWKITVETINFCKKLVKKPNQLFIGGVLATLLHKELEEAVGIKPMTGLLDEPGILDKRNKKAQNIIIDNLPLDYSILDEIDYEYPTRSAYFTFMTKGCTRKCAFCSVPILEPTYKPKIDTIDKFGEIKDRFGDQQNLLLMDNNVLASPRFPEIIDEIIEMGFGKDAKYIEPNQLEIAIKNLNSGYNDKGFTRRAFRLLNEMVSKIKTKETAQKYYNFLDEYNLLKFETTTKENILAVYPYISEIYEKHRNKSPKQRFVDFNQGTDCRYVTDELMKKMSEIPIRPLRLAFDYIGLKDKYVNAVRLAAKYGIKELSNYILYNFNDKPEDLYERLKINADLCKELDVAIFSFPMKYIPLFGEEAKHRKYTGKHWEKKFIRAIQSILNVTKGIVAPSSNNEKTSFFQEAFGKDLDEFWEILYMPETYIVYRHLLGKKLDFTEDWRKEYRNLPKKDLKIAQEIIEKNDFSEDTILSKKPSKRVIHFLRHYTIISRNEVEECGKEVEKIKARFEKLIKDDQFIELTLTHDFDQNRRNRKQKVYALAQSK
jgi:hypothetical protein